jgi:hypothetical protein
VPFCAFRGYDSPFLLATKNTRKHEILKDIAAIFCAFCAFRGYVSQLLLATKNTKSH